MRGIKDKIFERSEKQKIPLKFFCGLLTYRSFNRVNK